MKASARETGLSEDVGEIKDLAAPQGTALLKVNEPSSADDPAPKPVDTNAKTGS